MKDTSMVLASFMFTPDTTKKTLYYWGQELSAEPMAHRTSDRIVNCPPLDHNLNGVSVRFPPGQTQCAPVQVTALAEQALVTNPGAGPPPPPLFRLACSER